MPVYVCICAGNRPPDNGYGGDDSLTVLDVSNPTSPSYVGSIRGGGSPNHLYGLTNIARKGNYAFVCAPNEVWPSYRRPKLTVVTTGGTYEFIAIYDGDVWKSSDTLGYLGVHDAASGSFITDYNPNFAIGQWRDQMDSQIFYGVARGCVFFDTSSIPDDETILSATLDFVVGSVYQPGSNFNLVLVSGDDVHNPLVLNDYGALLDNTDALANEINVSGLESRDVITFTLNALGLSKISKTGQTAFGLRSSKDINATAPTDREQIQLYSKNATEGGRLTVIDISNPASPAFVASLAEAGIEGAYDIKIKGDYAFVVTGWENRLVAVDISDPAHPFVAGTVSYGALDMGWPMSLELKDNYAFIASEGYGLMVYDISDPTNMSYVTHLEDYYGVFVIVDGDYAYISDHWGWSLWIVNISNPASPTTVSTLLLNYSGYTSAPVGLAKVGNYLYVCGFGNWDFFIIDVSNPATPSVIGYLDIYTALGEMVGYDDISPRPREVVVKDNYAFITAADQQPKDGVLVLDISNPASIFIAGYILGSGAPNYLQMAYGLAFPPVGEIVIPTVTTDPASAIGPVNATLNGTLDNDGGEACECGFEWGETDSYGNTTPTESKTSDQTFLQAIASLNPGITYHFRAFAINSAGTGYGADRTFTTKSAPVVKTRGVTSIELDSAVLIGELIDDGGEACEVSFQWGLTEMYGNETTWQGGKHTQDGFWHIIASLEPDTTYHFRAQARNIIGTGTGEDMVFKTKKREEAEVGVPYSVLNPALLLLIEEEPVFV